ncbi:uncharacterized protein EDB91DRAFT_633015 [Suillus paluster]|uniref:uncharacterized protein n=1 Tax=Suillus paluster TaxID=48578 RepID=UPI001B86A69F|nr:uncharacterized protein EDB91DRAFT_633015 [Suillus paluster]KAG1733617.1 hypothetical protein EDB91DRAFT_633015 [Suillus paluster]
MRWTRCLSPLFLWQKLPPRPLKHSLLSKNRRNSQRSQACLPSTSSTPPRSLNPTPSASISPPPTEPTARGWSPRPLLVSSLVDGSPLRPRFLKRVAHRSTLPLENLFISRQSKTLQPLLQPPPSPLPSRKTGKRSLVGAQSCERDRPLPYASEFLKLIIVFIIFVLVLYSTFFHYDLYDK